MALTPLTWKMLPPMTVTTSGVHGILDTIYNCGRQTTYVDGTLKSASSTSWTWNRDNTNSINTGSTTAVYASLTTPNPSLLAQSTILIGSTSTPVAIKYARSGGSDVWSSSKIMAGLGKGSGSYLNWNVLGSSGTGTPFTSGEFTGYLSIASTSVSITTIMIFESQEALAIFGLDNSGNVRAGLFSGAFIDPLSSDLANAESDGRLYGISGLGAYTTTGIHPNWLSGGAGATYQDILTYYSSGSPLPTACVFNPGLGSVRYFGRAVAYTSPTLSFVTPAGDIPRIPIQIVYIITSITGFSGQLREIYLTKSGAMGSLLYELGTNHGYFISSSTSSFNESILLKA